MEKQNQLNYLYSLRRFGIKLGLEHVSKACELFGNPQKKFKSVLVAGTNGKGSVCTFVSSILQEAGFKVGRYTSPHLVEFNERIQINEEKISDDELIKLIEEVRGKLKKGQLHLTFFEFVTILSFIYFARKKVDFAVLEVGLGGRLDATNIAQPEIAVITNVGLEHVEHLGKTLEKIACEKAGIIHENSVLVTAEEKEEILKLFENICNEKNCEFVSVKKNFKIEKISSDLANFENQEFSVLSKENNFFYQNLRIKLLGQHQLKNATVAIAVAEQLNKKGFRVSKQNIKNGLAKAFWPGRFQVVQKNPTIIVDVSHNPLGSESLKKALDEFFPKKKLNFVFGVSSDKDLKKMVGFLHSKMKKVFVSRAKYRGMQTHLIANELSKRKVAFEVNDDVFEAVKKAVATLQQKDVLVITGSIFLADEAFNALKKLGKIDL